MEGFILYEYSLRDGTSHSVEAENIYELLEYLVKVARIHPSQVKAIKEKW